MPDIEVLRELTPQFPPPGLDDLVTVVHRRRRRAALTVGAGALVAVVVVASLIAGVPRSDRSIDPVTDPDGQTDDRAAEDPSWAPDRIRAEGRSRDYLNGQDGALEARSWRVCGKADCDYAETGDNYDYRVYHAALEVTVDGYRTSSLFSLNGGPGDWPETLMQPFDDDSVFVQDWDRPGGTEERYRLLNADGSTTELTMLPTTAAPAPGPDVVRTTYSSAAWRGSTTRPGPSSASTCRTRSTTGRSRRPTTSCGESRAAAPCTGRGLGATSPTASWSARIQTRTPCSSTTSLASPPGSRQSAWPSPSWAAARAFL